jgi:hypothetical protein
VSAEAKNKLLNLISAEDKRLVELVQAQRSHQSRASAFRDALAAIGSDGTPANSNMATSLKVMIDREEKDGGAVELKIEDAKTRKDALEQFVANLSGMRPNSGPPPRRPDYDYSHKDLREGTDIYSVRELLRKTGKPMLLLDIVTQLFGSQLISLKEGKYANLRGTLTGYAREGRIFTIESKSPHVIGLIEFKNLPKQ